MSLEIFIVVVDSTTKELGSSLAVLATKKWDV
jgi:hypothetical protein